MCVVRFDWARNYYISSILRYWDAFVACMLPFTRVLLSLFFPPFSTGINPAHDMGPHHVTLFGHWGNDIMMDWLPYLI